MNVNCPSCSKQINVPDSKVPKGKAFSFACPHCKEKVTAQGPSEDSPSPPTPAESPPAALVPSPAPASTTAFDQDAYDDVVHEEETHKFRALVCDPDHVPAWDSALREQEFSVTIAKDVEDALRKLRFNEYQLVVMNELYGTDNADANLVKHVLDTMSMVTRRKMIVILVGREFQTFDNMMSFVKSADVVMNQADISNLATIIRKSRNEHEIRYKVYREVLTAAGKR